MTKTEVNEEIEIYDEDGLMSFEIVFQEAEKEAFRVLWRKFENEVSDPKLDLLRMQSNLQTWDETASRTYTFGLTGTIYDYTNE